jgi:hypothetical protein
MVSLFYSQNNKKNNNVVHPFQNSQKTKTKISYCSKITVKKKNQHEQPQKEKPPKENGFQKKIFIYKF